MMIRIEQGYRGVAGLVVFLIPPTLVVWCFSFNLEVLRVS